jgi:hypothetical protein
MENLFLLLVSYLIVDKPKINRCCFFFFFSGSIQLRFLFFSLSNSSLWSCEFVTDCDEFALELQWTGSMMKIQPWISENCEEFIEFLVNCCFWRIKVLNWGWISGFLCVLIVTAKREKLESVSVIVMMCWIPHGFGTVTLFISSHVALWASEMWTPVSEPLTNSALLHLRLGGFSAIIEIQRTNMQLQKKD